MQLTNKMGLSEAWVKAVLAFMDAYDRKGWRSASDVSSPVRVSELKRRHHEELVEDVVDHIWALLGSAVHVVLEMASDGSALTETRFQVPVKGHNISMKPDRLEPIPNTNPTAYHLKDYKITTVWSWIFNDKAEWVCKSNLYAWGLRKIGINVTKITHEMLFKDWNHRDWLEAQRRDKRYPAEKVDVMPVELWSMEQGEAEILKRVEAIEQAIELPDEELPLCTPEDRWHRGDKYKVIKKGAKQAYRNFDTGPEAETFRRGMDPDKAALYEIQFFPGKSQRCESYCSANVFCNQYQAYMKEKKRS